MSAIKQTAPDLAESVSKADLCIKTKVWNDEKTTAHHGIIPTMHPGNSAVLNEKEKNLYKMIAQRYIANFYPDYTYEQKTITVEVNGLPYTFKATGQTPKVTGWKAVLGSEEKEKEKTETSQQLPSVSANQPAMMVKSGFTQKKIY